MSTRTKLIDLLVIGLDENLELPIGEVTQPETEIITSMEVSTNQQSSLNDLFLKTEHVERFEEITADDYIELKPTLTQPGLSLDNLFGETEEYTLPSTDELELGDLFDIPLVNSI